ncbi:MAG: cellulase family glycosylhydrolase [Verrucomicrobiae bacterium]|nr:cellulase family glycosylhydrolase [Verrucomicrobiae bacterium]
MRFLLLFFALGATLSAAPIRLHPDNPHYFEYKGKPLIIITSAEHYGALINLDFDYKQYLDTLHADGMNYTRLFMGAYVENPDSFGIKFNTLAPLENRLIVPWKRSSTSGYIHGGNKFDLKQWDEAYFDRLKDFLKRAADRNIIVEITLFSSIYRDGYWEFSPFHPNNNINDTQAEDRKKLQTLPVEGHNLLPYQEAYVRKLVHELNDFDNFFFEIQNEPWADNEVLAMDLLPQNRTEKRKWTSYVHVASDESLAWQRHLSHLIKNEEARLPKQHLIAQNFCNFKLPLTDVQQEISIINFHYAWPEAAYWNLGWDRVIGYDESGFLGTEDAVYRKKAWHFLMAGGGLYNNLDYSFVPGHEDGSFDNAGAEGGSPGGGSPSLRKQLKVLGDFLRGVDFTRMAPDQNLIAHAPGLFARGLAEPGKQYAVYFDGSGPADIRLNIPKGRYRIEWINTRTGKTLRKETVRSGDKGLTLTTPDFSEDVALRITK